MVSRIKQQNIFTNNSQLILGSQNNLIDVNNNIQSNTQLDSHSSLSPTKIPQMRSHSQHVSYNQNSNEISPLLVKQKRSRMAESTINLFQDTKQQLQQSMIDGINNTNIGLNQRQYQAPIKKLSMQDMLTDWLVSSNNNQTYNEIQQRAQQGNNHFSSNIISQPSVPSTNINSGSKIIGNEGSIRQNLQSQIQQTPFQNVRKTDNIYSSPTRIFPQSERSDKSTQKVYEVIEKQIINSTNSRNSSHNPFIKDQIESQSPVKPRFNYNQFQQTSQNQQTQDQVDQNQNGIDTQSSQNSQPVEMTSQILNANQNQQNKNSVQKWFNNSHAPDSLQVLEASNQLGIRLPSNSITQTQQNTSIQKYQKNLPALSTLIHNQQKKIPEILNTNIPGKSGLNGENSDDLNNYMRINQNGHMIPVVKQSLTNINSYQTSIGTKPIRSKLRFDSLIPIESNSLQNNADSVRDFLGIQKPTEEKRPINLINQQQQNGNNTVGRFKIRKVSQVPEDLININQPSQQITQQQIKNENQQEEELVQSSLTNLPYSPLLSPIPKQSRNITPMLSSMPNFQNVELDQSIQSPEINSNNINTNNIDNGSQNKRIIYRKKLVSSENEITSNKLELIKLQQAWKLDINNKPEDEKQQEEQQQNQQQEQEYMPSSMVMSQPLPNVLYNGENSSQYQYVKGAVLKSKGILKSKSPERNNSQSTQKNEESKVPQSEQIDSRQNFHAQEMLQANNLLGQRQLRALRKNNSMANIQTDITANRKKCVNFKETLRVINLNRGTESIERLKKPLTGSVIQ